MTEKEGSSKGDIFELLLETSKSQKETRRKQLLEPFNVQEFFEDGSIDINHRTCQGLECELCIKACPTKALYWQDGKVGTVKELCIYCGACVINCIVDDCITISRRRPDGTVERFSKPSEVLLLCSKLNWQRRRDKVKSLSTNAEAYARGLDAEPRKQSLHSTNKRERKKPGAES